MEGRIFTTRPGARRPIEGPTPAVAWALSELGPAEVTQIRVRPWAEIWRVDPAAGRWWLKVNAAGTAYEARLLVELSGTGSSLVPDSVSHPTHQALVIGPDAQFSP